MQALQGIKVIDLSRVLAGPSCTQILADFGAEVIKIERPGLGDETRHWSPPNFCNPGGEQVSAYFATVNRNKKSLSLDISTDYGQNVIKSLVADADILVENYKVGNLAKYGLDYDSLKTINPGLIYASLTGFGQTGADAHKAGYDYIIQGLSGLMSITGEPGGQPQKVGVAVVDLFSGLQLTVGILVALQARHHTGLGQYVDVALLDSGVAMLANIGMNYLASSKKPERLGNNHANIVPYQVFGASDGYFIVACGNDGQFIKLCHALGQNWHNDNRFKTNPNRVQNRLILTNLMQNMFETKTRQDWLNLISQAGVPCGPINTVDEALNSPQIIHRGMVVDFSKMTDMESGVKTLGNPIKLSDTPVTYRTPPPSLGQDTANILGGLGFSSEQINKLAQLGVI